MNAAAKKIITTTTKAAIKSEAWRLGYGASESEITNDVWHLVIVAQPEIAQLRGVRDYVETMVFNALSEDEA